MGAYASLRSKGANLFTNYMQGGKTPIDCMLACKRVRVCVRACTRVCLCLSCTSLLELYGAAVIVMVLGATRDSSPLDSADQDWIRLE